MIEFNTAILAGWIIYGYKALRIFNRNDYFIIEPVTELDFDDCDTNYYTIEIANNQSFEMASGVGLLEMKFYLDSVYVNETDYVLPQVAN